MTSVSLPTNGDDLDFDVHDAERFGTDVHPHAHSRCMSQGTLPSKISLMAMTTNTKAVSISITVSSEQPMGHSPLDPFQTSEVDKSRRQFEEWVTVIVPVIGEQRAVREQPAHRDSMPNVRKIDL